MKDKIEPAYDMYVKGIRAASQNLRNMEKATDNGGVKRDGRLSEADIPDYLNAGDRLNKNKAKAYNEGKKIILTSESDIVSYIEKSIEGDKSELASVAAYGIVSKRLADDVYRASKGKINIYDNYLELVSNDIHHTYNEHHIAKQDNNIDLSKDDFLSVPDYVDNYDELIYAIRYQNGNTKIGLSKTINGGKAVIVEVVSRSRGSVQFKNMFGMTDDGYDDFKAKYQKRNSPNTRGSESSNNTPRDGTVSTDIISDNSEKTIPNPKILCVILTISPLWIGTIF